MGHDKAFLEARGVSWLARAMELARAVGARRVWVSGRAGVEYGPLEEPVLLDALPGLGPLGGMERGLQVATQPLLLVLAVDLWRLNVGVLQRLHGATRAFVGAVPRTPRGWEPLVGYYPRHCLAAIQAALRQGRLSVTGLVREGMAEGWLQAWDVPQEDLAAFANANVPADLTSIAADR
jgi:molybdopterin-guanine dinucleotide biosynthesis protein A